MICQKLLTDNPSLDAILSAHSPVAHPAAFNYDCDMPCKLQAHANKLDYSAAWGKTIY